MDDQISSKHEDEDEVQGLRNPKAMIFLALWYIFSTLTLFLNKYIVDMQKGDAGLLGNHTLELCAHFFFLDCFVSMACPQKQGLKSIFLLVGTLIHHYTNTPADL